MSGVHAIGERYANGPLRLSAYGHRKTLIRCDVAISLTSKSRG
jgi:hypothetical protein